MTLHGCTGLFHAARQKEHGRVRSRRQIGVVKVEQTPQSKWDTMK